MKILCIGDSNTYGYDPRSYIGDRYPAEVRWTDRLENCDVINFGVNGMTIPRAPSGAQRGFSAASPASSRYAGLIKLHEPDLVIVMLGTNDMKVINAPAPEPSAIAMSEFLKTAMNPFLYEFCPVPKFLLISPVLVGDNLEKSFMYGQFDENSRKISRMLPDIYEGIAKRFGCEFMRASDFAKASETDSIHMDAENHRRLAEAICEKVRQIFA